MVRRCLEFILFLCLLIYASCGGSAGVSMDPERSSALIPAAQGGSLTSPDGKLTLVIPPGALNEDTEITIRKVAGSDGPEYEFLPDGLQFKEPAMAHLTVDLAGDPDLVDEDGNPLDLAKVSPHVPLFLRSADGSLEILDNVETHQEAGSEQVEVIAPIPHFTSLVASVGNSYYLYLSSLGTHYEGSSFKRDVDLRYLGYQHTDTYQNMSIDYLVRNVTVKKFKIETSGEIRVLTPAEITRSDFLSKRGDASSTRPKFHCQNVGEGTATVTAEVEGVLEVTLQPENKTLVRTIKHNSVVTRKGKCLKPSFGLNDFGGAPGDTRVALADPGSDYLLWMDGALEPVGPVEVPASTDYAQVFLSVRNGDALEANFAMNGEVPGANPEYLQYTSYNLAVLNDPSNESSQAFAGTSSLLAFEASSPGEALLPVFYQWDPELENWQISGLLEFDSVITEDGLSFLVSLEDLGLDPQTALETDYRAVSFIEMAEGYALAGDIYADTVELYF